MLYNVNCMPPTKDIKDLAITSINVLPIINIHVTYYYYIISDSEYYVRKV